jgi:hypothetical protein
VPCALVAALGSGAALALGDRNGDQNAAAQPAANVQAASPAGQAAKLAAPTPANSASSRQRGSDRQQTSGSGQE